MKKIIILLLVSLLASTAFAQEEKMEYEKVYLPKLQAAKQELAKAESTISAEKSEIANLRKQIQETEQQIVKTWDEIYASVGTDKEGWNSFKNELEGFEREIRRFGAMPNEELWKQKDKLDEFESKLAEYKSNKKSFLTVTYDMVNSMEQNIKSIRSSIVVPYVTSYVVQKNDNLWKISGKDDIYADPFKWTDIYKANKETIQNWQRKFNAELKEGQQEADLIYPDQEFTIPR